MSVPAPLPDLPAVAEPYLAAVLAGDRLAASRVASDFMQSGGSVIELYQQVIQPALYRVGELWEHNLISVAAEHMATAISEGVMNERYGDIIAGKHIGKTALIASVEKELHQVGAKMVSDVFEMRGWDAIYLGANTPLEDLVQMARARAVDLIGLSLSVYFHLPEMERMIDRIRQELPAIPIVIGGQGLTHVGAGVAQARDNVFYYPDLTKLDLSVDGFGRR